jgi:prevent-host-death family protein
MRTNLKTVDALGRIMRIVNVHEAKTHFSRLLDAAHAGETIMLAKGGRPWARLMPLEQPSAQRMPGVLAGKVTLPPPETLLAPLPDDELEAMERSLP